MINGKGQKLQHIPFIKLQGIIEVMSKCRPILYDLMLFAFFKNPFYYYKHNELRVELQ